MTGRSRIRALQKRLPPSAILPILAALLLLGGCQPDQAGAVEDPISQNPAAASTPVRIGLWFEQDAWNQLAADSLAWDALTRSSIGLIAYNGAPETLQTLPLPNGRGGGWGGADPPETPALRWARRVEWMPVSGLAFHRETDAERVPAAAASPGESNAGGPAAKTLETDIDRFRRAWRESGVASGTPVDLLHPHVLDSLTAARLAELPYGGPDARLDPPGLWLVRPAQYAAAQIARGGGDHLILDCYEAVPADCMPTGGPFPVSAEPAGAARAPTWLALHPAWENTAADLEQFARYARWMVSGGGGVLLVDGAWWVERLRESPDLDLAVTDLAQARLPAIPTSAGSLESSTDTRSATGLHLLTLLIGFGTLSIIRQDRHYTQRLYRFFVNLSLLELDQQDRRVNRWVDHLLLASITSVLTGTMGTLLLGRVLSPPGLRAIAEALPFAPGSSGSGSMEVFFTFTAAALAIQGLSVFWIWAGQRGRVPLPLTLSLLVWPLHLQGLWLLPMVVLNGQLDASTLLNLFGAYVGSSLLIFVLANLNAARTGGGGRLLGSLAGSLLYFAFWLGLLYAISFTSLWSHWIPLALSL